MVVPERRMCSFNISWENSLIFYSNKFEKARKFNLGNNKYNLLFKISLENYGWLQSTLLNAKYVPDFNLCYLIKWCIGRDVCTHNRLESYQVVKAPLRDMVRIR